MPRRILSRLLVATDGAVMIETAFAAPLLILASLGAFQISTIVARNSELVGAVSEAQSMVLAADLDTSEQRTKLKEALMASTELPQDKVSVTEAFRCNGDDTYEDAFSDCATGDRVSTYIKIELTDTYEPVWAKFGVGKPFQYDVDRYIMYKQATKK